MAKSYNQKIKLIHILHLLEEKTDEKHYLTAAQIIEELSKFDIRAERKSIYSDMNELMDYGYDIIHVRSKVNGGYYLASRDFELAEVKLLVDAVQSSKFITKKKSTQLIKKLEKLTSMYEAKTLQRQVYVTNRIKTENESIYYNIDAIHSAILNNHQIQFQYMDWNVRKELVPRKEGKYYVVSPYALVWSDERYYLVGFSKDEGEIRHYRVDKIGPIRLLDDKRELLENMAEFDVAKYSNKVFGMYGGTEEGITVGFPESMIGVFIDRFGKDVDIRKQDDGNLSARIRVVASGQFFGWLAGLGSEVKILSPKSAKEAYCGYLEKVLNSNRQ